MTLNVVTRVHMMIPWATIHVLMASQTTQSLSPSEVTQDGPDCQQHWAYVPLVGEYECIWPVSRSQQSACAGHFTEYGGRE